MTSPLNESRLTNLSPEQQLARLVRKHRQAYRLTQSQLAELAGLTQAAVANLEAGRSNPTLKTLKTLAAVFNLMPSITFRRSVKT